MKQTADTNQLIDVLKRIIRRISSRLCDASRGQQQAVVPPRSHRSRSVHEACMSRREDGVPDKKQTLSAALAGPIGTRASRALLPKTWLAAAAQLSVNLKSAV